MSHIIIIWNGRLRSWKTNFVFYMGLCLSLKHPQHFLQMYLQRGHPFKRSIFFKKKKIVPFWCCKSVKHWNTASCNWVRSGNSLICVVRFGKPFQHYNRRGLTVQDFLFEGKDWLDFHKRHGCVVGLLIIHAYKFALTDH